MNKTKIEWCDSTWNPVTGCLHGCEYCYARRIANRFAGFLPEENPSTLGFRRGGTIVELGNMQARQQKDGKIVPSFYPFGFTPTFHRYRLDEPQHQNNPQTIFVCSMADLFGEWVPDDWIEEVFFACEKATQHRYLFLTKNPKRYLELAKQGKLPMNDNMWYGSTITNPDTSYFVANGYNTFLSIEPLLEPFGEKADGFRYNGGIRWIILGAMTGPGSSKHQPEKSWVDEITGVADEMGTAIFMKESIIPIVGEQNMRRKFLWK